MAAGGNNNNQPGNDNNQPGNNNNQPGNDTNQPGNNDNNQPGYVDELDLPQTASASADGIVPGDELWRRNQRLNQILNSLDLAHLDDATLEQTGGPLTPQEQTLAAGVADFIRRFGPQLQKLGFNVEMMGNAFAVDAGLSQCEGANNQVLDVSRDVVFTVNGAMTESADNAEQTAAALKADPATSEAEVRNIDTGFTALVNFRQSLLQQSQQRQANTKEQNAERNAQLAAAQTQQKIAVVSHQMASAPLPEISALPGKKAASSASANKRSGRSAGGARARSAGPAAKRTRKSQGTGTRLAPPAVARPARPPVPRPTTKTGPKKENP